MNLYLGGSYISYLKKKEQRKKLLFQMVVDVTQNIEHTKSKKKDQKNWLQCLFDVFKHQITMKISHSLVLKKEKKDSISPNHKRVIQTHTNLKIKTIIDQIDIIKQQKKQKRKKKHTEKSPATTYKPFRNNRKLEI